MAAIRKTQKYLVTRDSDGDDVVWNLHRDLTLTRNAMPPHWLDGTDTPVIDLRDSDVVEYAPGQFKDMRSADGAPAQILHRVSRSQPILIPMEGTAPLAHE